MSTLTTTALAARHYRAAAETACRAGDPRPHLDLALCADPAFAVAAVDRAVVSGTPLPPVRRPGSRWERQHLEVMVALHAGRLLRAAALLQEHTAEYGCDPIAAAAMADRTGSAEGDGFARRCVTCPVHPPAPGGGHGIRQEP